MQVITVLVLFIGTAAASAIHRHVPAPALWHHNVRDDHGQFSFQYGSDDGTIVSEQGSLKLTPDGRDYVLVKQGAYRYFSPEGFPVELSYTADDQGFRPSSDSIPKPVHLVH